MGRACTNSHSASSQGNAPASSGLPTYEQATIPTPSLSRPQEKPSLTKASLSSPNADTAGPSSSSLSALLDDDSPSSQSSITSRCVMYLHRGDRLGLHGFPHYVVQEIVQLIPATWTKGVGSTNTAKSGSTEIKLSGMPWHGAKPDALPARRLVQALLHHLEMRGYALETSLITSRLGRALDQETLFFKPCQPRLREWCAVYTQHTDRISLVDWQGIEVMQGFKRAIDTWPLGIQDSKIKNDIQYKVKLKGTPWYAIDTAQVMQSRLLLASVMDEMDKEGYELVASIAVTMGIDAQDPGTMYFASKVSSFPA